jgi:integrase
MKTPKTKAGKRDVMLPALALERLRRIRLDQRKTHFAIGHRHTDDDLICADVDGSPWTPDVISKAFGRFVRMAGLPPISLHDLRHGCASLLLARNVHPKVVAAQLGHSRVGITLDRYSHLIGGALQEAAATQLDAALRSPTVAAVARQEGR